MNPSRVAQPASRRPAITPRKPSVTRAAPLWSFGANHAQRAKPVVSTPTSPLDAAQTLGETLSKAALASGTRAAEAGVKSGLRFMQFLRAYMRAFAAGLGCYVLSSELLSGHWNVLSMIGTHLFLFVAAPFYALVLAPSIFGMYRSLAALNIRAEYRAYIVGTTLGALLIVPRVLQGKFLLDSQFRSDLGSFAILAAGALAAYVFNREVKKLVGNGDTGGAPSVAAGLKPSSAC